MLLQPLSISSETYLVAQLRNMLGNLRKSCPKNRIYYGTAVLLTLVRSISARRQGAQEKSVLFHIESRNFADTRNFMGKGCSYVTHDTISQLQRIQRSN
jgi:hypothetical protein